MNIIGVLSVITFKTLSTTRDKKTNALPLLFRPYACSGIFPLKVCDVVLKVSSQL